MTGARLARHAARHWRGDLPLAVSFWIHLVALRVLVLGAQDALVGDEVPLRGLSVVPVAIALGVVHGALFCWQAVGTVRAAERHALDTGSPAGKLGSVLGVLVALWLTVSWALEGYRTTLDAPPVRSAAETLQRAREASYALERVDGGTTLRLSGPIVAGVTRRVAAGLEAPSDVEGVVLDSPGGNVHEARGLARLFRERDLWTHVDGTCASACAIAFIGGARRTLAPGARLGLHRWRMDTDRDVLVTDAASEQRRDAARYARAGVARGFVERMFDADPGAMWWPDHDTLLRAGVVHGIGTR